MADAGDQSKNLVIPALTGTSLLKVFGVFQTARRTGRQGTEIGGSCRLFLDKRTFLLSSAFHSQAISESTFRQANDLMLYQSPFFLVGQN